VSRAGIGLLWQFAGLLLAGCATVPLKETGAISSYESLVQSDGLLTRARIGVNKERVLATKSIEIVPTSFSPTAAAAGLSDLQQAMVSNAVDRLLCTGLSERFEIVAGSADLSVHAVITHVDLTDEKVAAASRVVSIGASVAAKLLLPVPVPVLVPRIPIGMGGLSVEAEARDPAGGQEAAIIWARGADALTSRPKVSTASDAYDLAKSFAADFSQLLTTASSPFNRLPPFPSMQSIGVALGGAPKEAICERFGRGPGIVGLISEKIGLPPEWTDKGAPANAANQP
jgi:hypothetical protein